MPITAVKPAGSTDTAYQDRRSRDRTAPAGAGPELIADGPKPFRNAKLKADQIIPFVTQLSVMIDSGVVLSDALDAIAEQSEPSTFKWIITDIAETVKSGENFSNALASYPRIFDSMFLSMVRASEASGRMVEMLNVVSDYITFEDETRKKIKGALTYPIIMAVMAVASTGTLMFFVLPRFMKIYEAKGASLPKITQVVVKISALVRDLQAMTIICSVIACIVGGLYYFGKTLTGRKVYHYIKIKTPVIGTMFTDTVITRSMRILSTMLGTGVGLLDSIRVIEDSTDNYYFKQLWSGVDKRIRDGYQLSESIQVLSGSRLIAPGVIQMLRAGERSGKLGQVCDKISIYYEKKLEASIKTVMTMIEPLMITILGAIIGTIAIALLLPVFKISSVVAQ